jgi:hypothetical protein
MDFVAYRNFGQILNALAIRCYQIIVRKCTHTLSFLSISSTIGLDLPAGIAGHYRTRRSMTDQARP